VEASFASGDLLGLGRFMISKFMVGVAGLFGTVSDKLKFGMACSSFKIPIRGEII
jgi:hypothetical protein